MEIDNTHTHKGLVHLDLLCRFFTTNFQRENSKENQSAWESPSWAPSLGQHEDRKLECPGQSHGENHPDRNAVWFPVLLLLNALLLWHRNYFKKRCGASLVAQWLRVCLPMQGIRVRALVWEDPTCRGATGPVSHNYWACASGACAPQQQRPRWWEARAPRWGVAPACRNWRKPSHRN